MGPDLQNILRSAYDKIYLMIIVRQYLRHSYDNCMLNHTISYVENLRQTCDRSYDIFRTNLKLLCKFGPWCFTIGVALWKQTPADSAKSSDQPQQATPSVVEEYRAKVNAERQQQREQQQQKQQQQQQQHLTLESDNSYKRAESDYSIDNLSQLFNAGEDAAPRYLQTRFWTVWI